MNWRRLLFKNSRRQAARYASYLAPNVVAVAVVVLFVNFLLEPGTTTGPLGRFIEELLNVSAVVVVLFCAFFLLYFHSLLLRLRGPEFALFTVLGVTPRQIGRLIARETAVLGVLAIVCGWMLGSGLSPLFDWTLERVLAQPPGPWNVRPATFLVTGILFGAMFFVDALWSGARIRRQSPIALFQSGRRTQTTRKPRPLVAFLSLATLGSGYALVASHGAKPPSLQWTLGTLALVTVATYGLLRSGLSTFFHWRRRSPRSGMRLVVGARLLHRLADHAGTYTVVAILTGMALTGFGAAFGIQAGTAANAVHVDPWTVQWVAPLGIHEPSLSAGKRIAQENGLRIQASTDISVLLGSFWYQHVSSYRAGPVGVTVMPRTVFNRLGSLLLRSHPHLGVYWVPVPPLGKREAVLDFPYPLLTGPLPNRSVNLRVGTRSLSLTIRTVTQARVLNESAGGVSDLLLIVNQSTYAKLAAQSVGADRWSVRSLGASPWQASGSTVTALHHMASPSSVTVTDTWTSYRTSIPVFASLVFTSGFLGGLLCLMVGALLSLRLFAQAQEDRRQFRALARMGATPSETRRMMTAEIALLFILPWLLGAADSTVAMTAFTHLYTMTTAVWTAFIAVMIVYLLALLGFFAASRASYLRQVGHAL